VDHCLCLDLFARLYSVF